MLKFLKFIPFFLVFLIIGSNFFWAPVCSGKLQLMNGNEVAMKCFYTGKASVLLSFLIVVMGIENLINNKISYMFFIGAGIILFFLPHSMWGIGVCKNEIMPCITTALWIRVTGIGAVLYGIVALIIKNKNQVPS